MRFEETVSLESPTGALLSLRQQPAAGSAKAVLIVSHGLAEHSARYSRFAGFLSERGYNVVAFDHRGHGQTRAPDAPLGRFAGTDGARKVLEDLRGVRNWAAAQYGGLPIILFGHSMGAMIALNAAEAFPLDFDALAVWNADLDPGLAGKAGTMLLKIERFLKGSDVPSLWAPRFTFDAWGKSIAGARTPLDWLSRDPAEVDAYIADPLSGFAASVSMWLDVLTFAENGGKREALSRLPKSLPVNLVGGGKDPATRGGKAISWLAERMRWLGMSNVSLTIYPEARHETLNDIGREAAMEAFARWADAVIAGKAGGKA